LTRCVRLPGAVQRFMRTKEYYDVCAKHGLAASCYENEHFPAADAVSSKVWEAPTNELTSTCADGYCPCP
jgi:hypothetical protein